MKALYTTEAGGGSPKLFKPIMYRTQVVSGVHYFIKVHSSRGTSRLCIILPSLPPESMSPQVQIDDTEGQPASCVHLKVLQEPMPKKIVLSLSAFQKDKKLDDPIEGF